MEASTATSSPNAVYVKELMAKKDKIEADIKTWYEVLESQGNVGTDTPLVDRQGYPRNDVDVVQVRKARHEIACLQNDHKALMKDIEAGLYQLHATKMVDASTSITNMDITPSPARPAMNAQSAQPFAAINLISASSPASESGLKHGDRIIEFGSVTHSNFTSLNTIAEVVQHSRGRPIRVVVLRDENEFVLSLTPREWEGRGLLGCNLVPM